MLVIKSYYQDGIDKLTEVYDMIKKKNQPGNRSASKIEHEN